MKYFSKAKEGDRVFGLVYGPGKISSVWDSDSYYNFEVTYDNNFSVPYTSDGVPGWGHNLDFQTVYYKKDIDIFDLDMSVNEEELTPKKIIKLRDKKKLMIKCPSGIWQPLECCPIQIAEQYLEDKKFYLFKKM